MPVLKTKKVGIIACSGEELPEGLVSRQAALRVLQELQPAKTVTLCLPLFLAGGERDRAFARLYPTIAIDGCDLRCAYRATEKYSAKPAEGIVVTQFAAEHGLGKIEGLRRLNAEGQAAVDQIAGVLSTRIVHLLGDENESTGTAAPAEESSANLPATCSCGSGIPVTHVVIEGKDREIVALPLIFDDFYKQGKIDPDKYTREIVETVKIYNHLQIENPDLLKAAIQDIYQSYLVQRSKE